MPSNGSPGWPPWASFFETISIASSEVGTAMIGVLDRAIIDDIAGGRLDEALAIPTAPTAPKNGT
jgi:hypothetical protein